MFFSQKPKYGISYIFWAVSFSSHLLRLDFYAAQCILKIFRFQRFYQNAKLPFYYSDFFLKKSQGAFPVLELIQFYYTIHDFVESLENVLLAILCKPKFSPGNKSASPSLPLSMLFGSVGQNILIPPLHIPKNFHDTFPKTPIPRCFVISRTFTKTQKLFKNANIRFFSVIPSCMLQKLLDDIHATKIWDTTLQKPKLQKVYIIFFQLLGLTGA